MIDHSLKVNSESAVIREHTEPLAVPSLLLSLCAQSAH